MPKLLGYSPPSDSAPTVPVDLAAALIPEPPAPPLGGWEVDLPGRHDLEAAARAVIAEVVADPAATADLLAPARARRDFLLGQLDAASRSAQVSPVEIQQITAELDRLRRWLGPTLGLPPDPRAAALAAVDPPVIPAAGPALVATIERLAAAADPNAAADAAWRAGELDPLAPPLRPPAGAPPVPRPADGGALGGLFSDVDSVLAAPPPTPAAMPGAPGELVSVGWDGRPAGAAVAASPAPVPGAGAATHITLAELGAAAGAPRVTTAHSRPGGGKGRPSERRAADRVARLYDATQHTEADGYRVHRDFASYFFRWAWASRRLPTGARVLDAGCGVDLALARVLAAPHLGGVARPGELVAVDALPLDPGTFKPAWLTVRGEFDVLARWAELSRDPGVGADFDVIVAFGLLERMDEERGRALLAVLAWLLRPGGTLYLSTPAAGGRVAASSVHEWTREALALALAGAGLEVTERRGCYGTPASLRGGLDAAAVATMDALAAWFDNEALAAIFAPLAPDASRDVAWVCRKADPAAPAPDPETP